MITFDTQPFERTHKVELTLTLTDNELLDFADAFGHCTESVTYPEYSSLVKYLSTLGLGEGRYW